MTRRILASATLAGALALSVLPGATVAQDTAESADENTPDKSVTGTITEVDGVWYVTPDGGEAIALSFGPSWFNDLYALFGLSGDEAGVTVGGNLRDGMPDENASDAATEAAAKHPQIKVLTVNDQRRDKGKPPWAGGPTGKVPPGQAKKADGDVPYGQAKKADGKVPYGQAMKAARQAGEPKPEKPGKGSQPPLEDD